MKQQQSTPIIKIPYLCAFCNNKINTISHSPTPEFISKIISSKSDKGLKIIPQEMECNNCKGFYFAINNFRWELLFELALRSFLDNYYNGSIGYFIAGLEHFYTFVLCTHMFSQNKDFLSEDVIKKILKNSVALEGAFTISYFSHTGNLPLILDQDGYELRNDVLHRGKFATKENAKEFGAKVFEVIHKNLLGLDSGFLKKAEELSRPKSYEEKTPIFLSLPAIFNHHVQGDQTLDQENFESCIEKLKKRCPRY